MYAPTVTKHVGASSRQRQAKLAERARPPAAPAAVPTAARSVARAPAPRARPLDPPPPADPRRDRPWRKRKSAAPKKRPSFAEQLAAATAGADDVTRDLAARHGRAAAPKQLLSTQATRLAVGRITSHSPGPLTFFKNHLVLSFADPRSEGVTIKMAIAYSDMVGVTLDTASSPCCLRFRVAVPLSHFAAEYDHTSAKDIVVVELGGAARTSGTLVTLQRVIERNISAAPRRGKGARYMSASSLRTTTTCTAERRGK